MTIDIVSQAASTNTALPYAKRDLMFDGTSGGVWGFDLANKLSYSRQAAPVSGAPITDLEIPAYGKGAGDVLLPSGRGAIGWSGAKFDFSTLTEGGVSVRGPASVMADIHGTAGSGATATCTISSGSVNAITIVGGGSGYIQGKARALFYGAGVTYPTEVICTVTGGVITAIPIPATTGWSVAPTITIIPGPQYFLWVGYMVLPVSTDWNTSTQNAGRMPMFALGDQTQADGLFGIHQITGGQMLFNRGTVGTLAQRNIILNVAADQFGTLCQVAYWRNASGSGARIKRVAAGAVDVSSIGTTAEANTASYAARQPRWGIDGAYGYTGTTWDAARVKAAKWKLARGWIEALDVTGRNPVDIIDRDLALTLARGVY